MAVDLVSVISQFLTPQLVGGLARAVGVNEAVAQRLVAAAIPAVLGAFATTAAAPGGAQKLVDAVSNSDPDLLSKLAGAIGGGNLGPLSEGATWLGGLLGGSGVASIAGALSQFSGAPPAAAQPAIGAVAQAAIGAIGQQDPSSWSDPASIAALFGEPEGRDRRRASSRSGEGPFDHGPARRARRTRRRGDADGERRRAPRRQRTDGRRPAAQARAEPPPAAARSSGFPMWAIIVLIVIVLVAVWWFMTQNHKAEPAKQGLLPPAIEYAIQTTWIAELKRTGGLEFVKVDFQGRSHGRDRPQRAGAAIPRRRRGPPGAGDDRRRLFQPALRRPDRRDHGAGREHGQSSGRDHARAGARSAGRDVWRQPRAGPRLRRHRRLDSARRRAQARRRRMAGPRARRPGARFRDRARRADGPRPGEGHVQCARRTHAGPQGPDLRPRLQHAVRGGGLPLRPDRPRRQRQRRPRPVHLAVGGQSWRTMSTTATARCTRATPSRRCWRRSSPIRTSGRSRSSPIPWATTSPSRRCARWRSATTACRPRSATSCWPRPISTSTCSAVRSPRSTPSRARPSSLCSSRATTRRSASRASSPATRPGSGRSIRPRSPMRRCSSRRG